MPKVSLSLEAAKAKDADILAKLAKVTQASQSHKQHTKLNQQRLEWTEQARKLVSESRRLELDVMEVAGNFGIHTELAVEKASGDESTADVWFQIAGVRQLVTQVKRRDSERLRRAPDQAISLLDVLRSVMAAISGLGSRLANQAAELDKECQPARQFLRRECAHEVNPASERHGEDRGNLSDDEDTLMERIGDGPEAFQTELGQLNNQVTTELAQLEQEIAQLRKKCSGWDEEANFRFKWIKRQFQGQNRELLMDRLSLEFPHLSREQLQAHEAVCDALRFASQRHTAAFRQWRRDRRQLLQRHQALLDERRRAEDALASRRQDMLEQKEKQKKLHGRLEVERARASSRRAERHRVQEEEDHRQRAAQADREDAYRKHVNAVKDRRRAYSEQRLHKQTQAEEEGAARERREAVEKTQRMERNAERIQLRRQMDELRQRELAQQKAAQEQEVREREHRLQQAMENLRVDAPRDPERLLKVPARAHAEAYMDPYVCVTRGPHAGFDEKRLMADARYKLAAALQAAGLFATEAGHQMLAKVPAPRPAQPHIVSSVFNDGYPA